MAGAQRRGNRRKEILTLWKSLCQPSLNTFCLFNICKLQEYAAAMLVHAGFLCASLPLGAKPSVNGLSEFSSPRSRSAALWMGQRVKSWGLAILTFQMTAARVTCLIAIGYRKEVPSRMGLDITILLIISKYCH